MALQHDLESGLAKAVRASGSQIAFADLIGKRQSVVNDWLRLNKELPAEFVFQVEAATGISRHELRPDLYPLEESEPVRHPAGQPPAAGSAPAQPAGGPDADPIEGLAA